MGMQTQKGCFLHVLMKRSAHFSSSPPCGADLPITPEQPVEWHGTGPCSLPWHHALISIGHGRGGNCRRILCIWTLHSDIEG